MAMNSLIPAGISATPPFAAISIAHHLITITVRCIPLILTAVLLSRESLPAVAEEIDTRQLPAFPGAEGFGAASSGGRGGKVLFVTTLKDHGRGSLRAACEERGRRTVVFRVGGNIGLNSPIVITNPGITIAGQTSPGGICLAAYPDNQGPLLIVATHDVVMRHMRLRRGPSMEKTRVGDCLEINEGSFRVIVDHCSMSWSIDEVVSTWFDAHDITVQWCFITEALNNSSHAAGAHSKGLLIGDRSTRISVHHNLFAHNLERNPRIKGGLVDVVNNVMYNPVGDPCGLSSDDGSAQVNFVGNVHLPGPDSRKDTYSIGAAVPEEPGRLQIYAEGNRSPRRPDDSYPEDVVIFRGSRQQLVSERFPTPQVTTTTADEAFEQVLNSAGATLPERDSIDRRIVTEVRNGTGRIIDSPAQVGRWPELPRGRAPRDGDRDGIPNAWEEEHGLSPTDRSDARRLAPSGYTWLEEYLNSLADSSLPETP